jgi:thymidylate synthase ThyX
MNTIIELTHHEKTIEGGGSVLILNTGAVINPEAEAMLQALHSRSIGGIKSHLKILNEKGSDKFMENFYVGYGHKSIGDCGTISIFIEGVSMLTAKAIQDWALYSGQEASTRYIDFQTQPFKNPAGNPEGEKILENWRKFYVDSLEETKEHIKQQFPKGESEVEVTYNKAINARVFDILRGFLPAGATTNLAWHTNLRQAADKIALLRHHPLKEVRDVTESIESVLLEAFPNSFGHKRYEQTENYNQLWMAGKENQNTYYYHNPNSPDFAIYHNSLDKTLLPENIISTRPPKTDLPRHLAEAGMLGFEFLLDFGSFRDIQRHRAVIQRMPLLTSEIGFEEWYLRELPEKVQEKAVILLKEQTEAIKSLTGISKEEEQYYLPMGYKISNRLTGSLPALVYLVELRATRFVHPTLREKAKLMAGALSEIFDNRYLALHLDQEADRFDVKRGEQDIVLKS